MHTDLFEYVFSIFLHTSIICSSFRIPPPPLAVYFFYKAFSGLGKNRDTNLQYAERHLWKCLICSEL